MAIKDRADAAGRRNGADRGDLAVRRRIRRTGGPDASVRCPERSTPRAYNRFVWFLRVAAFVAVALLVPALHASDDLVLRYRAGPVQPGDVLHLAVVAPAEVSSVTATWHEREVPFLRDADGIWRALLGIDVAAATGSRPLLLSASRPSAAALTSTHAVTVSPKAVRTRRIRVNPKFVTPPRSELPRIERETALLNELFRKTRSDRLWTTDAARPVEGVAVSGFGVRSILNGQRRGPHNGLDLAAVTGTPVYAPTPGIVAFARGFYYSGNTVIVDHGQGLYSTLAHLSEIDVKEGERVGKGALLGKVGATGRVTGPHLHWAVRLHGDRVDPLSLLEALAPKR